MSPSFEVPSHEALLAEQQSVQAEKFQGRLLDEYSRYIFPGQSWREPRGSAVVDFVRPIIGDVERASLDEVLIGLSELKGRKPIHWVDMGGGRALPMRQLGADQEVRQKIRMTNVDLFNFGLDDLKPSEVEALESLTPGITSAAAGPKLITDNAETVSLPEPADIITSVEAIQYLNNPLEAMANWYNQLADNGIMFIAAVHDWASWIRYQREPSSSDYDETPIKHVLEALSNAGVTFAATDESDWQGGVRPDLDPNRIRILGVQKLPGTSLKVTKPLTKVWVNPYNYKAAYYDAPGEEATPIVEVVTPVPRSALGTIALKKTP